MLDAFASVDRGHLIALESVFVNTKSEPESKCKTSNQTPHVNEVMWFPWWEQRLAWIRSPLLSKRGRNIIWKFVPDKQICLPKFYELCMIICTKFLGKALESHAPRAHDEDWWVLIYANRVARPSRNFKSGWVCSGKMHDVHNAMSRVSTWAVCVVSYLIAAIVCVSRFLRRYFRNSPCYLLLPETLSLVTWWLKKICSNSEFYRTRRLLFSWETHPRYSFIIIYAGPDVGNTSCLLLIFCPAS